MAPLTAVEKGKLEPVPGEGIRLTLTQEGGGTLISSTRYVHYGEMDFEFRRFLNAYADLETSKWNGVVSAAITMSDVKDEIDWEWAGSNTTEAQSNYFFMGHVNYSANAGKSHHVDMDTAAGFHTYTLNWQEDVLQWKIDGAVIREVLKVDTLQDGV